jgi:adenylosuccinate synthase
LNQCLYAEKVNKLNSLFITELDALDKVPSIKFCTSYINEQGKEYKGVMPAKIQELDHLNPQYKEFEGWNKDISQITAFDQLPVNAQDYLR